MFMDMRHACCRVSDQNVCRAFEDPLSFCSQKMKVGIMLCVANPSDALSAPDRLSLFSSLLHDPNSNGMTRQKPDKLKDCEETGGVGVLPA